MTWLWLLWLACAPPALVARLEVVPGGVEVTANVPVDRVTVRDELGAPIVSQRVAAPSTTVHAQAPLRAGARYVVAVHAGQQLASLSIDVPVAAHPFTARVEAPAGQGARSLVDGAVLPVTVVDGQPVHAALVLTAVEPGPVRVRIGGGELQSHRFTAAAEQAVFRFEVGRTPVDVVAGAIRATLQPRSVSLAAAKAALEIAAVEFPADSAGARDRARPADRVSLPARWWARGLRGLGLGYRTRDEQAPWAWTAVTVVNHSQQARNVVIGLRVLDGDGEPAHAFRPRLRELDGQSHRLSAVLRVPAGRSAVATLPMFVDGSAVGPERVSYEQEVTVTSIGSSTALHRVRRPLVASRGSWLASGGFAAVVAMSAIGLLAIALRGRDWLARARTSELTTIALFGSLTFVVATAARVLGYGVEAVLGPFAPLLTGLVDDAFRTALLASLVTLIPRPGVVTLASLVGYVLRGLALGAFHPADLLYFGSVVVLLESCLWLSGLTRGGEWREERRLVRWLRLCAGFAVANALATVAGLVTSIVLYRLFLADWYIAMITFFPGFLYVIIGCWLAVDFAESLRRVEP